jgi:hypothetical protein
VHARPATKASASARSPRTRTCSSVNQARPKSMPTGRAVARLGTEREGRSAYVCKRSSPMGRSRPTHRTMHGQRFIVETVWLTRIYVLFFIRTSQPTPPRSNTALECSNRASASDRIPGGWYPRARDRSRLGGRPDVVPRAVSREVRVTPPGVGTDCMAIGSPNRSPEFTRATGVEGRRRSTCRSRGRGRSPRSRARPRFSWGLRVASSDPCPRS